MEAIFSNLDLSSVKHMYVCMYVCMYVFTYVRIVCLYYVCMYSTFVRTYVLCLCYVCMKTLNFS